MNVRKIHSWKYYVTPHVFSSGTTLSPCIDIFHQTFQSEPLVSSPRLWSELWNTRHKDTRLKKKKKNHKRRQPLLNVNALWKCASMIHILSYGEESRVSKIYRFNKTRFKRSAYARQVMKKDPEFSQRNYYSLYIYAILFVR